MRRPRLFGQANISAQLIATSPRSSRRALPHDLTMETPRTRPFGAQTDGGFSQVSVSGLRNCGCRAKSFASMFALPSEPLRAAGRGVRRSGQRQPTVSLRVGRTPPSPVAGAETRREGGWRVDSVVGIQSGSTFSPPAKTEYRGKSVQNLLFFQSADVFGRIVSVKAVFWFLH